MSTEKKKSRSEEANLAIYAYFDALDDVRHAEERLEEAKKKVRDATVAIVGVVPCGRYHVTQYSNRYLPKNLILTIGRDDFGDPSVGHDPINDLDEKVRELDASEQEAGRAE